MSNRSIGEIMEYREALNRWGANKIATSYRIKTEEIALDSVAVEFMFEAGYACCGGADPNCYCSFAESPSADVVVTANDKNGRYYRWTMDVESFDFAHVLGELCQAADGTITA